MRSETEMVAYALEVDPALLPWIPELLADFDELGSNAAAIVDVLASLDLPAATRVIDLGCGKGAVTVAIARAFGWRSEGIELFEPFIQSCRDRAAAAGVSDRCRFHHADILKMAGQTEPADVAVYAALGDVLGPLDRTIGVIRRFVRPGGVMLVCEGYIKDGATAAFPGFEIFASPDDIRRRLQAHGDVITREVVEPIDHSALYAQELARIQQRVDDLADRRPDLKDALARYLKNQRSEYEYMAANTIPVIWVLRRGA